MEFCPECNFMLYTKLSHEIDGDETSALKLFNYCKNCGHQAEVIRDKISVYKRNYENDFIADKILSNKYTIYDSALPRLNMECVNDTCITNHSESDLNNTIYIKNVPEEMEDEDVIANFNILLHDFNSDIVDTKRIQLTLTGVILKDEADKTDFIDKLESKLSSLSEEHPLKGIEVDDEFEKPEREVLYIKYDPENMKYLYMCVNCGTSWLGNN